MRTAHIQAVATEKKHPALVEWWHDGQGDKSAVVRLALEWFFGLKPQLDRIETMLEVLVKGLKHDDGIDS